MVSSTLVIIDPSKELEPVQHQTIPWPNAEYIAEHIEMKIERI